MSDRDDEARWGYPGDGPGAGRNGRSRDESGSDLDDGLTRGSPAFPADLAAVQADDALLDALGSADARLSPSDEPLASVLLQWRREVDAEPAAELVDTDTAMSLVAGARQRPQRPPRRNPVLLPFAVAAALAVIAFSGVGLAAKSAEPQDRLWGITQVLYPQHARSVEAATQVRSQLERADTFLQQGDEAAAQVALDRAEQDLGAVAEGDGRDQLAERHEVLWSKLDGQPEKQDEPAAPPAASSSSTPPSEPARQPPVSSDPAERRERAQTTAPPDEQTGTSRPEPSSETSSPVAGSPSTSPQSHSATPSGRTTPAPEAGAGDRSATGSGVAEGPGSGSAEEPDGGEPAEPTT